MAEVLDIVVRQRGARTVAKDIAQIGVSAGTATTQLKRMDTQLRSNSATFGQVSAGSQKFTNQCAKLDRCTKQTNAGLAKSRTSLVGVGAAATLAGGAITAGFLRPLSAAIQSAGEFQQAMNLTGVLLNVDRASAAFERLERTALELGRTTQFTAVQAAEGLAFLAKTGLDVDEALAAIPETLKIAAAASIDLGRASDITTNILRGFRLELDELPGAVDILASTFSNANVDVEQLAQSFKKVGPVAAEFGQEFADVAVIVGTLGNAGVQAEEAGTALRRLFINLENDAAKSTSILKKFGISIRDDVTGQFRPLIDIFKDISKAPIEPAERIRLFGARALAAAGIIENSSDTLRDFADAVENDVGRAAEIGAARLFGFDGAVIQLNSALEGLGIAIAQSGLLDFLTVVISGFTTFVRALAALPRPVLAVIGTITALIGAIGALLVPIGLALFAFATIAPLLAGISFAGIAAGAATFGAALLTVLGPIALIIGALFLFRDTEFKVGDSTVTLSALIEESFARASEAIDFAVNFWTSSLDKAKDAFQQFLTDIDFAGEFQDELDSVNFNNFVIGLRTAFVGGLRIIFEFLSRAAVGLAGFASDLVQFLGNIPSAIKAAFDFDDATDAGEILGDTFKNGILTQFEGFGAEAGEILLQEGVKAQKFVAQLGESDFIRSAARRATETAEEAAGGGGKGGPKKGDAEDTTGGATDRFTQSQLRALDAVNRLTAAFTPGAAQVLKLNDAVTTLNNAVKENVITTAEAGVTFENLRKKAGDDFLATLDPVTAAINEQRDALAQLTAVSELFGLTQDQTAAAQATIIEQTNTRLLQLQQFKEGLTGIQAAQLGVTEGIREFAESFGTQFDIIKNGVVTLAGTITNQLTNAIKTGTFSFQEFALSVVQGIQDIIVKLLIQIALQAALAALPGGAAGGGLLGAALGATPAQGGAQARPGESFLVGEEGPELFKAPSTGEIIPTAQTAAMMGGGGPAPEVNVQVVNVDDNAGVPDAMSTREGEQVILNVIQRNKNQLREIIG